MTNKYLIGLLADAGSGKDTVADIIRHHRVGVVTISFAEPLKELLLWVFHVDQEALYGSSRLRNQTIPGSDEDAFWNAANDRLSPYLKNWIPRVLGTSDDERCHLFSCAIQDWFLDRRVEALEDTKCGGEVEDDLEFVMIPSSPLCVGTTIRRLLQTLGTETGRTFDPQIWVNRTKREIDSLLGIPNTSFVVVTDVRMLNEAQMIIDKGGEVWRIDRDVMSAADDGKDDFRKHASETGIRSPEMKLLTSRVINNNSSIPALEAAVKASIWDLERRTSLKGPHDS